MLSLKLPTELETKLNTLAAVTHRSKSFYVRKALEEYLATHEWQVRDIVSAVEAADAPNAKFVDHDKVEAWLESWGTAQETEPPKCV